MLRFAVLASCVALTPACRLSLEDDAAAVVVDSGVDAAVSPTCMEATQHSDLKWIEEKVFRQSCIFSGCHNGAPTDAGRLDLRPDGTPGSGTVPPATGGPGRTGPFLVNVASEIDTGYKLVVPGKPNESYLMMMIQHIKREDMSPPAGVPMSGGRVVPLMPQNAGGKPICVEKREAIQRWILAGAKVN
jgi:hypothetical protein